MGFYKLRVLRRAIDAPDMLPADLPPSVSPMLNRRIERFLDGFTSPAEMPADAAPVLPVKVPRMDLLTLRRRWLAVMDGVCGSDRSTLRRGKERVRDLFKRLFKAS